MQSRPCCPEIARSPPETRFGNLHTAVAQTSTCNFRAGQIFSRACKIIPWCDDDRKPLLL